MAKGKYAEWLEDDKLLLLQGWATNGLTDEQIAKNMGINVATIYEWKKKYPKIDEVLKKSKEVADFEVENALHKNATGYYYFEDTITKEGIIKIEKWAKPDTTAQIFWLKNRRAKQWREKQEIEQITDKATSDALARIEDIIKKRFSK